MPGRRPAPQTDEEAWVLRKFGERLRWLREAWEAREPGRHSQAQWAEALVAMDKAAMSRWEAGLVPMPPDIVWRVAMVTGASCDYLYFGVLSDCMEPWLIDYLQAHHRSLVSPETLQDRRGELRAIARWWGYRPRRNRGGRQLPKTPLLPTKPNATQ